MTLADLLPFAALPILAHAAAHDVAVRRVPDSTSVAVAALGLAARALDGGLGAALLAMAAVFLALFACWKRGWLGGGDVKLLTACSALVPAGSVPGLFLAISLCGGVLALVYLGARAIRLRPRPLRPLPWRPLPLRPLPLRPVPRPGDARVPQLRALPLRVLRAERWRLGRQPTLPYACAIASGAFITVFGS